MLVAAKVRFTLLGRNQRGYPIYGDAKSKTKYSDRWFVYICPTCGTETAFERSDFIKHLGTNFSNLMYPDRQAMERGSAARLTNENAFVDFYCAGCKSAVRTYYRYDAPERNYGLLELKTVIEQPSGVKPS